MKRISGGTNFNGTNHKATAEWLGIKPPTYRYSDGTYGNRYRKTADATFQGIAFSAEDRDRMIATASNGKRHVTSLPYQDVFLIYC
jgi:hypothetical protein